VLAFGLEEVVMEISELIRTLMKAYVGRDRKTVDALLHEKLVFSSPYDPHLDKRQYFERCWDGGDGFRAMRIEKLFVGGTRGDEAFVRYEVETKDGKRFRNVELMRAEDGKIREIEVYFGQLPAELP
jgi:ketosteroid isomerase-like protein